MVMVPDASEELNALGKIVEGLLVQIDRLEGLLDQAAVTPEDPNELSRTISDDLRVTRGRVNAIKGDQGIEEDDDRILELEVRLEAAEEKMGQIMERIEERREYLLQQMDEKMDRIHDQISDVEDLTDLDE